MVTPALKPEISSYIQQFPIAINHSFFRPYFTETTGILSIISAIESYLLITIIVIAVIFFRNSIAILNQPFTLLLVSFAFINYLLIGYTVPFSGAVVRYRVVFELFLLIPTILMIDKDNLISNQLDNLQRKIVNYLPKGAN
jgi:hypothetical protein